MNPTPRPLRANPQRPALGRPFRATAKSLIFLTIVIHEQGLRASLPTAAARFALGRKKSMRYHGLAARLYLPA